MDWLKRMAKALRGAAETGAEAYGSASQPMAPEHAKNMANVLADMTPGIGDIKSGIEGVQAAREGDWLGAGMGGLGALPMVPNLGGVIRNIYHGTSPEAAALIKRRGFDLKQSADGTVWFTENPAIGEVGAARKGAIVKRQIDDEKLKLGGWEEYDRYGTGELISQGYDGLKLVDGPDDFPVYRLFKPNKTTKKVKD